MDKAVLDYMLSQGRAPSIDSRGNVRGFRSKPGAPMANPNNNIGALKNTPSSLTNLGNWHDMFKPRLGQPAGTPSPASTPPASASDVSPGGWGSNNDFSPNLGAPDGAPLASARPAPVPSLDVLAAGGLTHAQSWGAHALTGTPNPLAGTGSETGDPMAIFAKYGVPGTQASSFASGSPTTGGYKYKDSPGGFWSQGGQTKFFEGPAVTPKQYGWGSSYSPAAT